MIVRHDDQVDRQHAAQCDGHGLKALRTCELRRRGALSPDRVGEHPQASISISNVECPSQVARSPLAGDLAQVSSGLIEGSGPFGTRRSPPQRNSLIVGIAALGSRKPGRMGCTFLNPSPAQREDARIRSNRAPRDLLPSDFMMGSY